ncbi:T9SS type A sorting domain-containing protein [Hymenobacter ruricola]|uniref:T9SS type A sorting domain-containing protein n=1 Tax=Hymenobacter ruricola TaxID=2791023 RepID=A0ABS0I7F2_9BACT|nr:T9SS type A sorting domain-containing protein [Hymenobacter ruricola]MBF9222893.1 T9SS type A sorting domain-containing protein [Hymenobacter ruricola]
MKSFLRLTPLALGLLLANAPASHATNPVLTFRGTVTTGDNTAFIDQVQVLTGTTQAAGAVANASFESADPLANGTYGYIPTGAVWTFNGGSGIANTGAGFSPSTPPDGSRVAFLQGATQFQQTLTLAPGTYRVRFSASQRFYPAVTNVQKLDVLIDGISVLAAVQPPSSSVYNTYLTAPFTVVASTPFALTALAPTRNQLGVDRTSDVDLTFTAPTTAAAVLETNIFSSQYGGLLNLKKVPTISGNTATITPARYYKAGEVISVTVPNTVVSAALGQASNNAQVYQFTVATQNNGTGNGTFSGAQNPGVGTNPRGVATADVDGDGRLDIIVASEANVSVFRNTGNSGSPAAPTFAARVVLNLPTNAIAYGMAVGDVNGDGRLDIVTANSGPNNVSVFRNTGTAAGTVSFATSQQYAVGTTPFGVALGDVDADGDLDIVTANFDSNDLTVLQNVLLPAAVQAANGLAVSSTLTATSFITGATVANGNNSAPASVALADFDNDGLLDIAVASSGPNNVNIYRNTTGSPGALAFATRVTSTVGATPYGVVAGDVNADGKVDLVTANRDANSVSVLLNASTGVGSIATSGIELGVGADPISVALGDVNADGYLDIMAANYNNLNGRTVSTILRNAANTGFATAVSTTYATANSGPRNIVLGDLDGDGDLDFVVASQLPDAVSYRINGTTAAVLPLPVALVSFTAECRGTDVALSWRTASEKNSRGFEVQRAADGQKFTALSFVEGLGTSATGGSYAFTDRSATGAAYYRLRQVDADGTESYSPVATASCGTTGLAPARLTLLPNPAQGRVQVLGATGGTVQLLDLTGRLLRQQPAGETLSLEGLAPGVYLVRNGAQSARLQVQ